MNKNTATKAEPVISTGLDSLKWQVGNMAMSNTHFYMIYTDPKEGLTVSWHNKITGASDKRHGFKDKDDASDWIEKTHHATKDEENQERVKTAGYKVGQQWVHRIMHAVMLEILEIGNLSVYAKVFSSENTDNTSGLIEYSAHEFQQFIKTDYLAILDGETIADCLLRNGSK